MLTAVARRHHEVGLVGAASRVAKLQFDQRHVALSRARAPLVAVAEL